MTSDFYKGNNLGKGALLRTSGANLSVMSPVTGENIPLTEVRMPSEKVMDSIYKLRSNTRSLKLLNRVSVCDILPEIIQDKRNTKPVIAVKDKDGKYEIVEGLRRSFAVSLAPGAELVLHYATSMTEEEKRLLAKRADTYKAPGLIDLGQSLLELEESMGAEYSVRNAAKEFGVAVSKISVAYRTAKIPSDLYKLFPDISFISVKFLSEIVKNEYSDFIVDVLSNFTPFDDVSLDLNDDEVLESVKVKTQQIESSILSFLRKRFNENKKPSKQTSSTQEEWPASQLPAGVTATMTGKKVKLALTQEFLETEIGMKIKSLLLSANNG